MHKFAPYSPKGCAALDFITNNSMRLLQKGLDFNWQKQRVISENIANVETPGYKAKYVSFEDELRRSIAGQKTSGQVAKAISDARIQVKTDRSASLRLDGNNVNADAENVELARTQLQYDYLVRQISDQFTRLRAVISAR